MLHSVHLMFGKQFADTIKAFKTYIIKYGEEQLIPYIDTLLWESNANGSLTLSRIEVRIGQNDDPFVSGIQDMYDVEMNSIQTFPADKRDTYVINFFEELFNNTINNNKTGDSPSLYLYLYLPLYDKDVWKEIRNLIDILSGLKVSYHIDIIGLASDTAVLFTSDKERATLPERKAEYDRTMKETITSVIQYKKQHQGVISHFIVFQNYQKEGYSLQLDQDIFVRIIGEVAFLCTEHYRTLFLSIDSNVDTDINALGLSILSFDKYYFVQYLLRRTYLHIMDRERIMDTKVDISKATEISQEKLKGRIRLVSDFYKKEIDPLLIKNVSHESIVVQVIPKLNLLIDEIKDDLQAFLADKNLSLPEKKAALATLLGLDDALLTGYDFNHNLLILDDIEQEPAQIFIDANNKLRTKGNSSNAVLSPNEDANLQIEEIKSLRRKIRESTTYIRSKEEQLKKIKKKKENAEEEDKRLTEDGYFVYKGNRYRLNPKDVVEQPLSTTYTPSKISTSGIDLRANFSRIKNQGSQGSCTAFTMCSIYEYILKANKALNSDLSEAFLYYNARKKAGNENEDSGSSFFNAIGSLIESGICMETLFPYNESVYNQQPSPAAYEDALNRLVKVAMNVRVSLDDIRSALADGYPVAISLKLYDSFSVDKTGFVSRPSESEIQSGKYGNHAMVICGFSDDKKIFIVRNSWGDHFGDNGYCYIPYSYIGDSSLLNIACIITEIGGDYITVGNGKQIQAFFNTSDANIHYAIIKNLVDEEKYRLQFLIREESIVRQQYYTLIERLRNNNLRNQLVQGMSGYLEEEKEEFRIKQNDARKNKVHILDNFRKRTQLIMLRLIAIVTGMWCIFGTLFYTFAAKDILSKKEAWIYLSISAIIIAFLFFYYPYRMRKKRRLKEDLEQEIISWGVLIDKNDKQLSELRLKMHIHGMFLDKLFDINDSLNNKHSIMQSFNGNLQTWYEELKHEVKEMDASTKSPFISLISNEVLDAYFEKNRQNIAKELYLSDFINGYEVSEEGIIKFKKELKTSIINSISALITDFKVYSHIAKSKNYPYLDNTYANYDRLLPELNEKSKVFLRLTAEAVNETPHKVIFIRTDTEAEKNTWNNKYPNLFDLNPVSENMLSKNKIMLVRVMNLQAHCVDVANN